MIVAWLIMDEAHIATLAVHPDYRQQGVGRKLVSTALGGLIRKGAVKAMLEVRAQNITAQSLYHNFGFEVVGRRKQYYQDNNEDGLLMTLSDLGEAYLAQLGDGKLKSLNAHKDLITSRMETSQNILGSTGS
jgi:ribosomal-protein-alanine N-acetyltransferase